MPLFKFRLNTILTLALTRRDQCRAEMAEIATRIHIVERQIEDLDKELVALANLGRVRAGAIDVGRLLSQDRYATVLREQRAELEHEQSALAAELAQCRERLVEADREVKMFETLRDKQHAQFLAEERGREQRMLDEIGTRSHGDADTG